ncbi:glycosyltransferase family 4 protein [Aquidulcibacter sp.]|uniref:glycosyltransferase family 4 protein n=1 Tax=Aquidulcibacter sp. TaxID=2052990 RepID=UPI0025BFDC67|nr:glycosyltransferase family 4 protein [Aquidulcibacter sp.]MCA3693459.1 glycosyltransferase family 4 protein [Aquidulcibacter sp.]
MPLRICMILPEYDGFGGGIMTFYRHLAPALVRAGAEVTVIEGSGYASAPEQAQRLIEGVQVEVLNSARVASWVERFGDLTSVPTLRRNLAAAWASWEQAQVHGPFDVVEATDFGLLMVPPILEAKIPVVMQMHGSIGQIHSYDPNTGEELAGLMALAIETEVARAATMIQTHSRANRNYWARATGRHDIELLLPAWAPSTAVELTSPDVRQVISVFGRIQMWKGPKVLSEALEQIPNCPDVHWYGRDLIDSETGLGSTKAELRKLYPTIWENRIITHAPVPPEAVQALQASSLLNLVPSTWDVFNFTVAEAMASGRPVICSDRAGAAELIEDGVTGFVYDGSSARALATALQRAAQRDPRDLTRIGIAAKERILSTLQPDKIAIERLNAYKAAINSKVAVGEVPDWLRQLATPKGVTGSNYRFLEKLPLRPLIDHILVRTARKLGVS